MNRVKMIQDLRPDIAEALQFYDQHYDFIVQYMLKSPGKDIFLPTAEQNACRFCKKKSPEVTFKLKAHAIPELLGNQTLFSTYDCNSCNQCFGQGIENDLGNWSKPIRNLTQD